MCAGSPALLGTPSRSTDCCGRHSRRVPFRESPCQALKVLIGDSKFPCGGARVGALWGLEALKVSATWVEEGPSSARAQLRKRERARRNPGCYFRRLWRWRWGRLPVTVTATAPSRVLGPGRPSRHRASAAADGARSPRARTLAPTRRARIPPGQARRRRRQPPGSPLENEPALEAGLETPGRAERAHGAVTSNKPDLTRPVTTSRGITAGPRLPVQALQARAQFGLVAALHLPRCLWRPNLNRVRWWRMQCVPRLRRAGHGAAVGSSARGKL